MIPDNELSDLLTTTFLSRGGNRALARLRADEAVKALRQNRLGVFREPPPAGSDQVIGTTEPHAATSSGAR